MDNGMGFASKLVLALAFSSTLLLSEQVGTFAYQRPSRLAVEDGLMISITESQVVEIHDLTGRLLVGIDPLQNRPDTLPDATAVSVHDASVKKDQAIAIAAVFTKPDAPPQARLLIYDSSGGLKSSVPLPSSREIARLAFDDQQNIWTMTLGSGFDEKPSNVPMIVEYDSSGKELRTLLTRDAFPIHAKMNRGSLDHGFTTLGYDHGTLWFWMPESNDLVNIQTDTGVFERVKTSEPPLPKGIGPLMLFRVSPQTYVLKTTHNGAAQGLSGRPLYIWSSDTKEWQHIDYPAGCREGYTVLGVLDGDLLFINYDSGNLCAGPVVSQRSVVSGPVAQNRAHP